MDLDWGTICGVNARELSVDPFLFHGFDATHDQQFDCARNWVRLKKREGHGKDMEYRHQFPIETNRIAYLSPTNGECGDKRSSSGTVSKLHDGTD